MKPKTELPWHLEYIKGFPVIVDDHGMNILDEIEEKNAEFIVTAVNSYKAFLTACKQALEDHYFDRTNESYGLMEDTVNKIKKAIALAEGKKV